MTPRLPCRGSTCTHHPAVGTSAQKALPETAFAGLTLLFALWARGMPFKPVFHPSFYHIIRPAAATELVY